ncbi:class I SAM-dependent methyltransferase [Niabella soli]|uniref:class I SAM-dependent methyltransferase n=1 Tax=Niabella soli TaxID=446683 RepID=UPI0002499582|nr:class I SAM-dependent methyltransferase [Niabella soli]
MAIKDYFSSQSDQYAKYRPTYPPDFFNYLNTITPRKKNAWDCGTGNGQIAYELAKTFEHIFATDISQSQIDHALQAVNISYSVQPAEKTDFDNHLFDLIIVAQAIHWFDFEQFYAEVRRTATKDALLCVTGYGNIKISEEIDPIIADFYTNVIGTYWDKERKYIDEGYATIPFPFDEIETPQFENRQQWTLEHLIGYLNTWSAVKHFIKQNGYNPVEKLHAALKEFWGDGAKKEVCFPLLLRIGKI